LWEARIPEAGFNLDGNLIRHLLPAAGPHRPGECASGAFPPQYLKAIVHDATHRDYPGHCEIRVDSLDQTSSLKLESQSEHHFPERESIGSGQVRICSLSSRGLTLTGFGFDIFALINNPITMDIQIT